MKTFFYFGYGSNMMTNRLIARCSSARAKGLAFAEGYRLTFWKPSDDGSGKGHLVAQQGTCQPGVLFEIRLAEQPDLDDIEGVGRGYRREDHFPVRPAGLGQVVQVTTYLATSPREDLVPYDWYLALIVTGAREHGIADEVILRMLESRYRSDPLLNRRRRLEAVRLLAEAGTTIEDALGPAVSRAGRP